MKMTNIKITSKISNQLQQKLSLKPGQIIKAQVIKTEKNQVLLKLGSTLLNAQTKVPLKTGDRLTLQVESSQRNSIELKIIDDYARVKPEEAALAKLGMPPQEEMDAIFRQLVKFNLPVSQAAIMELHSLLKGNKFAGDLTQLIIWLTTVEVKIDSKRDFEALDALRKFFNGELAGDEENRFFTFLNETENSIYGGFNIFGWPVAGHHIFLLTQGSKHEPLQAEGCKLLLQLNSQNFEELWFKLELGRTNIKAEIICNNDKYQTILGSEVGRLSQALQTAGYKIDKIAVEVCKFKQTIFDFIPRQTPRIFDIDVQV